jgi:MFS family permease
LTILNQLSEAGQVNDVNRRGGLWRHADFRRLWIGDSISQVGTAVSQLALPLVAITVVHASTLQIGLLTAVETLGFLLVGLPAGAWVDRMRRRRVLITTDLSRAVAIGSVPVAEAAWQVSMTQLYVVAMIAGVSTVFFDVAYQSYLPELVGREDLVEGNAKLQASQSAAQVAGPSIGGLMIHLITAPYAVLVDACSFLWSAGWVASIQARPGKAVRAPDRNIFREMKEGLGLVFRSRLLVANFLTTGTSNFFGAASVPLTLILFARNLQLSALVIGLLLSIVSAGGLIGAILARRVAAWLGHGPAIWMTILCTAPYGLVLPWVHRDWTLAVVAVLGLGLGVAVVIFNVVTVSFRQGLAPPHLLGRMNATMRFFVWGTMPLGALLGGLLGSAFGVRIALLGLGVGASLAFLPAFFSPLRTMRDLPVLNPSI